MHYLNKLLFTCVTLLSVTTLMGQQVIISEDSNPSGHPSAILDIQSTDKGLLIPRVATAVRDTMNTAPNGLIVYDVDEQALYCKSGGSWMKLETPNNIFERVGDTIRQVEGYASDHFVIGSPGLDYDGVHLRRMFFDRSNAAFRAGIDFGKWKKEMIGQFSTAMGSNTEASGDYSTAFGYQAIASGSASTSFGQLSKASGSSSVAFGSNTHASGLLSLAFGNGAQASGAYSLAGGYLTKASENASFAFGRNAEANGSASTAFGNNTKANASYCTVVGQWNDTLVGVNEYTYFPLFIVGDGSPPYPNPPFDDFPAVRSNALTVHANGRTALGNIIPQEVLDVDGKIRMRSGAVAGYVPISDADGSMTWSDPVSLGFNAKWSESGNDIYRESGYVGIGLSNPTKPLDVYAPNLPGNDTIAKFRIGAPGTNDGFSIWNGTNNSTRFAPVMSGRGDSELAPAFYIIGTSTSDVGAQPMLVFDGRTPTGQISTRPLFEWRNYGAARMTMLANGNLGIGVVPSSYKFHVEGNSFMNGALTINHELKAAGASGLKFTSDDGISRMRINDAGKVYIGNNLPQDFSTSALDVEGGNIFFTEGYGVLSIGSNISAGFDTDIGGELQLMAGGTRHLYIKSTGLVGVGVNDPGVKFQVGSNGDGTIARANSWSTFSDARFKHNVTPIHSALSTLLLLRGTRFEWNESQMKDIGFIAQEVEKVLPEIVQTSEDGYKSVDYARINAVLVEAVKEQQTIIDDQEKRIKALEEKIEKIMSTIK